jgi:hypothetical protein
MKKNYMLLKIKAFKSRVSDILCFVLVAKMQLLHTGLSPKPPEKYLTSKH